MKKNGGEHIAFNPNGWDPTEADIADMAGSLGLPLDEEGNVNHVDAVLLTYSATQMEHEGEVGPTTINTTMQNYGGLMAGLQREVERISGELQESREIEQEEAESLAAARATSELLERAARKIAERKGLVKK